MTLRTKQLLASVLTWVITLYVIGMCGDLLYRASLHNSLLLGDPYYQDTILATERAPLALGLCWGVVVLGLALAWVRRK